jgi:hypothetical protein
MRKLFALVLISMLTMLVATSCTDQQRAKKWGGSMSYNIAEGEHFVNATWKDADLWIITQNDATGVYYMQESSNWGILEGKVTITDPGEYKARTPQTPNVPNKTELPVDPAAVKLPPGSN